MSYFPPSASFSQVPTVSVFGKTIAHGDFVRIRANGDAGRELQRTLVEGVERLSSSNLTLSDEPISFVVPDASATTVAVGVMRASQDAVGRRFPLAVFAELPFRFFDGRLSLVPVAMASFLGDAEDLLERARVYDAATLERALTGIRIPDAMAVQGARALCRDALAREDARRFLERSFGDLTLGTHHYGIDTLLRATRPEPRTSRVGDLVLECPVSIDVDLFGWLEIIDRRVRGAVPVAVAWTESPPRLLVSLGPPRATFLSYVARPGHDGQGLWPLFTRVESAIRTAESRLSPGLRGLLAGEGTLGALVDGVVREGGPT